MTSAVTACSVMRLYEQRNAIVGMRALWAPEGLRHFTAHLQPL